MFQPPPGPDPARGDDGKEQKGSSAMNGGPNDERVPSKKQARDNTWIVACGLGSALFSVLFYWKYWVLSARSRAIASAPIFSVAQLVSSGYTGYVALRGAAWSLLCDAGEPCLICERNTVTRRTRHNSDMGGTAQNPRDVAREVTVHGPVRFALQDPTTPGPAVEIRHLDREVVAGALSRVTNTRLGSDSSQRTLTQTVWALIYGENSTQEHRQRDVLTSGTHLTVIGHAAHFSNGLSMVGPTSNEISRPSIVSVDTVQDIQAREAGNSFVYRNLSIAALALAAGCMAYAMHASRARRRAAARLFRRELRARRRRARGAAGVDRRVRELCVVCLSEPRKVLFAPCGHYGCCAVCAAAVERCPLCRGGISAVHTVFNP